MPVNPAEDRGVPTSTARRASKSDGVYIIFLGSSIILLLALTLMIHPSQSTAKDFRVVYFPTRTLLAGLNPYNPEHVLQTVRLAGEESSIAEPVDREIQARYVYPPTTFAFTIPFALLAWRAAFILWMVAGTIGLILSSLAAWDLSRDYAPIAGAILIAYVLANSEVVVVLSNPSALAISLAVAGAWCVFKNRFSALGVILFALSLCLKPQDAGLIWCFFFLTSPDLRKRSIQIALLTAVLSIPVVLWVWHVSPDWLAQLKENYAVLTRPGGPADPGPLDPDSELVNLQVIFSRIKDDPSFYNLLSYIVGGPMLLLWGFLTVRSGRLPEQLLLSLAALVPLSLLPVYHHFYDTKLLLLCVPGFAVMWSRPGHIRWFALALTLAALLVTGDLSHTVLNRNHLGGWMQQLIPSFPVLLAPLTLLANGVFYLWALWRSPIELGDRSIALAAR